MTRSTGVGRGRKPGVTVTESSTLFSRLRHAMGDADGPLTITALSLQVGISEKTGRTYNKGVIPKTGDVRRKLERLAKQHGVPIQEPEA